MSTSPSAATPSGAAAAGHGTTWQELNRTRWDDWYAVVDAAFRELHERCGRVFVGGLSMGGALALALAQEHGPRVSGLVLVNPAVKFDDWRVRLVPVLKYVMPSAAAIASDIKKPGVVELAYDRSPVHAAHSQFTAWKNVIRDLPEVTQPVLLLHSPEDHVVPAVELGAGPRADLQRGLHGDPAPRQLPRGYPRQRCATYL